MYRLLGPRGRRGCRWETGGSADSLGAYNVEVGRQGEPRTMEGRIWRPGILGWGLLRELGFPNIGVWGPGFSSLRGFPCDLGLGVTYLLRGVQGNRSSAELDTEKGERCTMALGRAAGGRVPGAHR